MNDFVESVKTSIATRIDDPFWNQKFSDNLPKWIHIWVATVGLGSGMLFILNSMLGLVDGTATFPRLLGLLGLICLTLMIMNRDTFLPFLAENFVPEKFLKLKERQPAKAEKTIQVSVGKPSAKVLYWAADPGTEIRATWQEGYGKFENSGVVTSDARGLAQIPLVCPSRYIVHGYKILPKHVHYRVFDASTQMLSRIFTVVLTNECVN
jgi:hypothetical protein